MSPSVSYAVMFSAQTFRKFFIYSSKSIAWLLYVAAMEYCVRSVTMYFLREKEEEDENDGKVNDAVFFKEKNNDCWSHVCNRQSCGEDCSYAKLRKLIVCMEKSEHSLDLCIYHLTSYDLAFSILDAHNRGVKVRIIADYHRIKGSGSQIRYLMERGVSVRSWNNQREMHHKFFIVDGSTLVNCSFNWTMQAITGNSEDASICSEKASVQTFLGHFNAFWDKLET